MPGYPPDNQVNYWLEIGDEKRRVKVCDDRLTQSINVCTHENAEGSYIEKQYFTNVGPREFRFRRESLEQFADVASLISALRTRSYQQIRSLIGADDRDDGFAD